MLKLIQKFATSTHHLTRVHCKSNLLCILQRTLFTTDYWQVFTHLIEQRVQFVTDTAQSRNFGRCCRCNKQECRWFCSFNLYIVLHVFFNVLVLHYCHSRFAICLCCIIPTHINCLYNLLACCTIYLSCCATCLCCIATHVVLLLYVYNCVALPLMGCIIVDYTVSFTCVVLYWRSCCTIALLMSSCHACCAICLLVLYYFHSLVMLRYLYCLSLMLWYLIGTHACCALSPCVCERTCPLCAPLCVCHCPRVCARLPHLTSLHITSLTSPHCVCACPPVCARALTLSPNLPHSTPPHSTSPHLTHITPPHLTVCALAPLCVRALTLSPNLPHSTPPHLT